MNAIKFEYGTESVAFFGHGSGDKWFAEYLPGAWGSPNAAKPSVSLCTGPRETASQYTFGRGIAGHEQIDWDETDYIVLIGHHIGEDTHNTQLQDFSQALKRGAKLVVVDPRFSVAAVQGQGLAAGQAGTDTALLLAWLNVLVRRSSTTRRTSRSTRSASSSSSSTSRPTPPSGPPRSPRSRPTPSAASPARWPPRAARRAPGQPPRGLVRRRRHPPHARALPGQHAAGQLRHAGRLLLLRRPHRRGLPAPRAAALARLRRLRRRQHRGGGRLALPAGGRPRQVLRHRDRRAGAHRADDHGRALPDQGALLYGVNLFHSIPMVERTKEALRNLDLYVAIDVLPMEHVMWADVILPECTYLERYDDLLLQAHKTPFITARFPAIEPMYDTKPSWWIARELGIKLGLGEYFPWPDIEEYLDRRLSSIGSSLEAMREQGTIVRRGRPYFADWERLNRNPIGTPSGKIEIYSERFAEAGLDPLPVFVPPDRGARRHYRLLYGRSPVHTFARTHNNPVLMEMHGENEVWLSTREAEKLGVRPTSTSTSRTRTASARARCGPTSPSGSATTASTSSTASATRRR
jgi:thiosulfate reductase / polysulfide reductase chain A